MLEDEIDIKNKKNENNSLDENLKKLFDSSNIKLDDDDT